MVSFLLSYLPLCEIVIFISHSMCYEGGRGEGGRGEGGKGRKGDIDVFVSPDYHIFIKLLLNPIHIHFTTSF